MDYSNKEIVCRHLGPNRLVEAQRQHDQRSNLKQDKKTPKVRHLRSEKDIRKTPFLMKGISENNPWMLEGDESVDFMTQNFGNTVWELFNALRSSSAFMLFYTGNHVISITLFQQNDGSIKGEWYDPNSQKSKKFMVKNLNQLKNLQLCHFLSKNEMKKYKCTRGGSINLYRNPKELHDNHLLLQSIKRMPTPDAIRNIYNLSSSKLKENATSKLREKSDEAILTDILNEDEDTDCYELFIKFLELVDHLRSEGKIIKTFIKNYSKHRSDDNLLKEIIVYLAKKGEGRITDIIEGILESEYDQDNKVELILELANHKMYITDLNVQLINKNRMFASCDQLIRNLINRSSSITEDNKKLLLNALFDSQTIDETK